MSDPVRLRPDPEVADQLGHQLVRFIRLVGRATAHFAASWQDGVELPSYLLLARLVTDGPQRLTALAEAVHSDPSTVSRQTSSLVRHGLVKRQTDPADGRACLLLATDEGERVFHHNRRERNKHIAQLISNWSAEDQRMLVFLLDRLNSSFETHKPHLTSAPVQVYGRGETP